MVSAIPSPTCPLLIDEYAMILIMNWRAIYDTDYHLIDNLNHDININWNDLEEYSDFFSTDSILFCDSVEYPFTEEHVYYNDSTDRLFGEWFKQDTSLELWKLFIHLFFETQYDNRIDGYSVFKNQFW